jgi:hypothetical protein
MATDVYELIDRDSQSDTQELTPGAPTTAELAECTCPEFCERDHDID